jgi:hypothetical protein
MTTPAHDDAKSPERAAAPEGRDTPALGGGKRRKKVKPLEGEAAIERPYDPGVPQQEPDPWQDPGGSEPHNG